MSATTRSQLDGCSRVRRRLGELLRWGLGGRRTARVEGLGLRRWPIYYQLVSFVQLCPGISVCRCLDLDKIYPAVSVCPAPLGSRRLLFLSECLTGRGIRGHGLDLSVATRHDG